MRRPAGRRTRVRPVARVAGRACVAAGACAEEVPLPGPVVDGPVVKLPAGRRGQGQRAALGARRRRRRRSASTTTAAPTRPTPTCCRCRSSPTAARSCAPTATARARSCSPASGSSSTSASARRCRPRARTTRRAAACPTSPAPSRSAPTSIVELWQSSDRKLKLELRLPVREAITLERSPRAIGLTFSPNLNLDISGLPGKGNLGLLAGPLFADQRYHQYFYGVAPEFATASAAGLRRARAATPAGARPRPSRAASATPGSARSSATTICTARNLPRARWCRKRNHRHCRLRHLMDLRDFEPARTDRRLSGETAQAPALRHRVFFACRHRPAGRDVARLDRARAAAVAAVAARDRRPARPHRRVVHLSLLLGERRAARPDARSIRARSTSCATSPAA